MLKDKILLQSMLIDAINAIGAKSKEPDSTSIVKYINQTFSTNAHEYISIKSYKSTSKGNSHFILEANNKIILETETERIHDNAKGNTLKYRPNLQYTTDSSDR